MNNLTINIGLNVNNNEPKEQYSYTLNALLRTFKTFVHRIDEGGQWNQNKERVFVVSVNVGSLNLHAIKILLTNLCIDLEQDAISFKLNNEGQMVFDPHYKGKIFNFSEEKFINF